MAVGNLTEFTYTVLHIRVEWHQEKFTPLEPIAETIPDRWRSICELALQRGRFLTDGKLARLHSYHADSEGMTLTLQPTSYSVFVTTNLSLDLPIVKSGENGPVSIRELAGSQLFSYPSLYLANPLNVLGMIITTDGTTFTPRRSASVYESPKYITMLSRWGSLLPGEHPAQGLLREIKEELGIDVTETNIEFAGLGVNLATGEPDLIAVIRPNLTYPQLKELFKASAEKDEFRDIPHTVRSREFKKHNIQLATSGLEPTLRQGHVC